MQVTKRTWCIREQCVPGSLSSFPAREPGNEASLRSSGKNLGFKGIYFNLNLLFNEGV